MYNYRQQQNLFLLFLLIISSFTITLVVISRNPAANTTTSKVKLSILNSNLPNNKANNQNILSTTNNILQDNSNLFFEKNLGQFGSNNILFSFRSKDFIVYFLPSSIQFYQKIPSTLQTLSYKISFKNSNHVIPSGLNQMIRVNNYFIGNEKFANVPLFKGIIYKNIYNGINLQYYFTNQQLKYEFLVHPGVNPNQIEMISSPNTYFSMEGANLGINTKLTNINLLTDNNLFVYQNINSNTMKIPANFTINPIASNKLSYQIGQYDTSHELIIDPILVVNASTYLGGSGVDSAVDIVMDGQKYSYITGTTTSSNFTTLNPLQSSLNGSTDIFVMKINTSGTGIIWATYYGGSGVDTPTRIALDGQSNVVIAGSTDSPNFPLVNSHFTSLNGTLEVFVVALSNTGNKILLSSIIGGTIEDNTLGLYIPSGTTNYYLTGSTYSVSFPTTSNAYDSTFSNGTSSLGDAFLTEITQSGSITYSTYIGINGDTGGVDVGIDSQNNIYVMGTNLTKTGSTLPILKTFIIKFSSSFSFVKATLFGGSYKTIPTSMAIFNNSIYITGQTYSNNFPVTPNAFNKTQESGKGFVTEFDRSFSIVYSTLFGNKTMYPNKILVNSAGQATVAGSTTSTYLSLLDEYKTDLTGSETGFIITLNNQGSNVTYATYFGGNNIDHINSIALGSHSEIYLVGDTQSLNFPVFDAIHSHLSNIGSEDAFFTRLSLDYTTPSLTIKPNFNYNVGSTGNNLTFSATDNDPLASFTIFKNGASVKTGFLPALNFNYSVDGLTIGKYNYTVVAKDRSGHSIAKTCLIDVINLSTSTQPHISTFVLIELYTLIVVLGLVSVLIASYIQKKRMNKNQDNTLKEISQEETISSEVVSTTDSSHQIETQEEVTSKDQSTTNSKPFNDGNTQDSTNEL